MTNFNVMANLGVLISGSNPESMTPEKAIVLSFESALNDLGGLILIHTWIQKNHDLIHAEALFQELKSRPEVIRLVAGSLFETNDKRFNKILKLADASPVPKLGRVISFAVTIGQTAPMSCFEKFGLTVSTFKLEADRKFRTRESMIETNQYFFTRSLFGPNWRADVAAQILLDPKKTPTEIKESIGCSYETAHRNQKELVKIGWNKKVQAAFKTESK